MGFLAKLKQKINKSESTATIGLCLGGGGARGYAHIGALKAFEEAKISFNLCGGTSVGSLIAALYCAGVKSDELIKIGESLQLKDIHNGLIISPNDPFKIGRVVTNIIGDALIEHLPKKFFAVAVDLIEGKQVILDKGKVATAVSASCCVPLFFKPVIDKGRHLVDGGLLNNIPADVCRMMGADKVVSVDINPTRGTGTKELGLLDVLKATFSIMSAGSSTAGIINSDILVAADTSRFSSTKKDGFEAMIELGYEAAKQQISAIRGLG